jgi:hypothetical protein
MDEEQLSQLLDEVLWPYGQYRIEQAKREARQFVHYTTTEAALSIITNQEIWLRNSGVMNDYSEMAHGEACLRYCLFENADVVTRAKRVLDAVQEGLFDRTVQYFVDSSQMRRAFTYLLSISEHGPLVVAPGVVDEESQYGRLSMWRAYGSRGGVALIFGQEPIFNPTNVLDVYASPVFYGNPDAFAFLFNTVLTNIERRLDEIKHVDPEIIFDNIKRFIHFSSLTCKHPGFAEEREWRITYSANPLAEHVSDDEFNASSKIKREFRVINGIPQRIYKIPFVDYPEETSESIRLPAILKQVVIGPTQYPTVIFDSLVMAMRRIGFPDDRIRINASNIPIRT